MIVQVRFYNGPFFVEHPHLENLLFPWIIKSGFLIELDVRLYERKHCIQ